MIRYAMCKALALAIALAVSGCSYAPHRRAHPAAPLPAGLARPVVSEVGVSRLHFLGPSEGEPARALASELSALFTQVPAIERAYLVKVGYGPEMGEGLALALAVTSSVPDQLLETIGTAMASTLGTATALDVIEIDAAQERIVAALAVPFYGKPLR